ncbi:MAG: PHP domain-containing protein [Lachnospiraceae bacterium]
MDRITYDFHIHSCLSPCGDDEMTPENIAAMASLIGLDAIALTDHNSCKNCEALLAAAGTYGLLAIPGMELCTSEEVHVLCYFATLENALSFDSYVADHSLHILNKPEYFGNQLVYNCEDRIAYSLPELLISASTISFSQLPALMLEFGGIMVPAHLDKSSTSLISNLGFIPPDSTFTCAEVKNPHCIPTLRKEHPYLEHCHIISSSDAHQLADIQEATHILHVNEKTVFGILTALEPGGCNFCSFIKP